MAGRGRPKETTNVIEVNNIKLEYIHTKHIIMKMKYHILK